MVVVERRSRIVFVGYSSMSIYFQGGMTAARAGARFAAPCFVAMSS